MYQESRTPLRRGLLSALAVGSIVAFGTVVCCGRVSGDTPEAPLITPHGPEITIEPGTLQSIRAQATGASTYEWTLSGSGQLSLSTGPTALYTAPKQGGTMAIVTVTAKNEHGSSAPTAIAISVLALSSASLESLGVPAGWISGIGNPSSWIEMGTSSTDCHSPPGCLKFTHEPGGNWSGIYWWPLNCGERGDDAAWNRVRTSSCGVDLVKAGNFTTVKRLAFWARGENGDEVIEFKVGGPDVAPVPGRSTGKVALKPGWQELEIDLEGVDASRMIGLFLWLATDLDNPNGASFYLDDVRFEGVK